MYTGIREKNLFATCATALTKNKLLLLNKTTGVATYATCGSIPDGFSTQDAQSSAGAYSVAVNYMRLAQSFFARMFSACTQGAALVCAPLGTVAAALHTVTNMHTADTPSPGANAKYIVPAAGWSGDHENALAVYTHVGTSWAYTEMTADTAGLVVLNSVDNRLYIWTGTAWTIAPVIGYSAAAGVADEDIAVYNTKQTTSIDRLALTGNYAIIAFLSSTSENDADASVVITDPRILSTDKAVPVSLVATAAVLIKTITVTAGTVTVALSGNGGAATVATVMLVRAI